MDLAKIKHFPKTPLLLNLYHTMTTFDDLRKKPFENIVGKEENAGNKHFLLFHNVFYPMKDNFNILSYI